MTESRQHGLARPLRRAGRTIATVAAVWFVAALTGSAVAEGVGSLTIESGTLVFLGVMALAGAFQYSDNA